MLTSNCILIWNREALRSSKMNQNQSHRNKCILYQHSLFGRLQNNLEDGRSSQGKDFIHFGRQEGIKCGSVADESIDPSKNTMIIKTESPSFVMCVYQGRLARGEWTHPILVYDLLRTVWFYLYSYKIPLFQSSGNFYVLSVYFMNPQILLRSRRIFITHIRQVGWGDDVSPGSDEEPVNIQRSGGHNKGAKNHKYKNLFATNNACFYRCSAASCSRPTGRWMNVGSHSRVDGWRFPCSFVQIQIGSRREDSTGIFRQLYTSMHWRVKPKGCIVLQER